LLKLSGFFKKNQEGVSNSKLALQEYTITSNSIRSASQLKAHEPEGAKKASARVDS
jgi:hypothetical protein